MKQLKPILFFLTGFAMLSFSNKVVKNEYYRTEKFKGHVKQVAIVSYGRLQKQSEGINDTLTWLDTEKIKLDKAGKEIERSVYNQKDSLLYTDTINYSAKGERLERIFRNKEGALVKKILYRYDDNGRKIEEHHIKPDGSLEHNVTYKYDARGNCTEWASFSARGVLVGKQTFYYDAKNNNTQEVWWFLADSSRNQKLVYTYNDKGQEVERKKYTLSDSLKYKDVSSYDYTGSLMKMERFDTGNNIVPGFSNTYQYEYDKKGNWIKKEVQAKGKTGYLYLRKIEYY